MVMDISLKNLDFEEENRLFSLRIKSISEKLLLENLNFCVMRQGNIKGFYWVIKQPSGFLYANKDSLFTRICGRNPVPGVRQAGDISTLLQF